MIKKTKDIKNTKNVIDKKNEKKSLKEKFKILCASIFTTLILATEQVYAASNTESIDGFINFACDWLVKIGGVIALVGGVMFALGWQREDAEGKSRGLMTLMAGFMLVAIAQSKNLFGL